MSKPARGQHLSPSSARQGFLRPGALLLTLGDRFRAVRVYKCSMERKCLLFALHQYCVDGGSKGCIASACFIKKLVAMLRAVERRGSDQVTVHAWHSARISCSQGQVHFLFILTYSSISVSVFTHALCHCAQKCSLVLDLYASLSLHFTFKLDRCLNCLMMILPAVILTCYELIASS